MSKLLLIFLLLTSCSGFASSDSGRAKIELGIGLFALSAPDYIGSANSQNQLLPFPYIKYRGDRFSIDDGVEARLLKTDNLLLSISGNGSLPSSSGNAERTGMQKLDATFEIGPSLEYRLIHEEATSVWLEIPFRLAFSVGENNGYVGQVFNPKIAWRKKSQNKNDWKLRLAAGLLYSDDDFHSYYYNVSPTDALPNRPAYRATKGYTGSRTEFTYSKRINNFWLGGFVRYDNLSDSVIEDSPLVSVTNNWTAGIAFAWILLEK